MFNDDLDKKWTSGNELTGHNLIVDGGRTS